MNILDTAVFFGGAEQIGNNDFAKVEVANFTTDVDAVLTAQFGWASRAIAAVGLTLSWDNLRIQQGTFITRGHLELKDKKMAANTIWPTAKANVSFVIQFPNANVFEFDSGGLWSNLVPSSAVKYSFYDTDEGRSGQKLLGTDERLAGIGDFCIRLIAQLSSTSCAARGVMMKYVVLLFPGDAEEVGVGVESTLAGWPGIKIAEGYMPLGPTSNTRWRCPILPFIRPAEPFSEDDVAPSCDKIRAAVAAVMRNAKGHDIVKTRVLL